MHLFLLHSTRLSLFNTQKPLGSETAEKHAQGLNRGVSGAKASMLTIIKNSCVCGKGGGNLSV